MRHPRVIPAPAGIGRRSRWSARHPSGYPRACGDRLEFLEAQGSDVGLSPRLRGSVHALARQVGEVRVIPAPAGIGFPRPPRWRTRSGYPRACGDRAYDEIQELRTGGLSPRLRGSGRSLVLAGRLARVIPAPAGIGGFSLLICWMTPGYPRACGDRSNDAYVVEDYGGLSPRLRGSAALDDEQPAGFRVIPAPAGIGPSHTRDPRQRAGYPRACGDRFFAPFNSASARGLSPRLRGSGLIQCINDLGSRVIPAPAGIGLDI